MLQTLLVSEKISFISISEYFVSSSLIICGDFNFVENENLETHSDSKRLFSSCPTFINIAENITSMIF